MRNQCLDYLIDPSFQEVNRIVVLSIENNTDRAVHTKYYLPTVEIKDYNVIIDGWNISINVRKIATGQGDDYTTACMIDGQSTSINIRKVGTGQGDDYATACLSGCNYFNKKLSNESNRFNKQQALDADPKSVQQINFTRNLARDEKENTTIFFSIEKARETKLDFSNKTIKVL